MATEGEARVLGYDELASGSKTLFRNIGEEAPRAFEDVASGVASAVSSVVPRRSGTLAGSVAVEQTGDRTGVGIGDGVPYAGWIEFGGNRGRPYVPEGRYLFPAATSAGVEDLLEEAAARSADNEIGDMRWPSPN